MNRRTIRLFISKTFRDFGDELDMPIKWVFPALRRLNGRSVKLVHMDLRRNSLNKAF